MKRMRHFGKLACSLLLVATAAVRAQISDPNRMVVGPPKAKAPRPKGPGQLGAGELQWLWQYAQPAPDGNAVALRNDERFPALLERSFHQPQAVWGKDVPLAAIIPRFVSRFGAVNTRENRYLTVDGCVPSFCAAHGMLWVDLGSPEPLLVFAAVNWTTETHTTDEANADYNLWLFPSRPMAADALPFALTASLARWDARLAAAHRGVPHIAHALLVEPDGQPFPLNPVLAGANTLPPQVDTVAPRPPED